MCSCRNCAPPAPGPQGPGALVCKWSEVDTFYADGNSAGCFRTCLWRRWCWWLFPVGRITLQLKAPLSDQISASYQHLVRIRVRRQSAADYQQTHRRRDYMQLTGQPANRPFGFFYDFTATRGPGAIRRLQSKSASLVV